MEHMSMMERMGCIFAAGCLVVLCAYLLRRRRMCAVDRKLEDPLPPGLAVGGVEGVSLLPGMATGVGLPIRDVFEVLGSRC